MLRPVEAKEIPTEQAIFNEAWMLIKTYHNISAWDNDTEWEELLKRAETLFNMGNKENHTDKLGQSIALAVLDYLEALSKDNINVIENVDARKKV